MSFQAKILSLLSDVTDASLRVQVMSTMNLFRDALSRGVDESEVLRDIIDVVYTVLDFKDPFLDPEAKRAKAEEIARDLLRAMKMEIMHKRTLGRMRERLGLGAPTI